jgi:hypothetical protein
MYRIELSPGEETAFRSIEELAVAIRRKVVTSHARIYHNATSRWLPIQFHPHYQIALSMPLTQADLVAGPPVAPLSVLKLGDQQAATDFTALPAPSSRQAATQAALHAWPEPKPSTPPAPQPAAPDTKKRVAPAAPPIVLGTPAPEPRSAIARPVEQPHRVVEPRRAAEPRRIVEPVRATQPVRLAEPPRMVERRSAEAVPTKRSTRRKSQRVLRIALAAAMLIACVQLVITAASSAAGELAARPRTPRQLIQAPAEALKEITPRTVGAVMPVLQSIPVPALMSSSSPEPAAEPVAKEPTATTAGFAPPQRITAFTRAPAPAAAGSDSVPAAEPDIEAAPDAGSIAAPAPLQAESLTGPIVDSIGKGTFKRMLRTINGSPPSQAKPAKR